MLSRGKKTVFFTNQEKLQILLPTQKNCRFLPTQKNSRFFYQLRKLHFFTNPGKLCADFDSCYKEIEYDFLKEINY